MYGKLKYVIVVFLLLMVCTAVCSAASVYVSDRIKISMRSTPGPGHKIIKMLDSGSALVVLEQSGAWSKVRTADGRVGWALTRFLVNRKPAVIVVEELKRKTATLVDTVAQLRSENKRITEENKRLAGIEEKYIKLEKDSKSFFELKAKYNDILIKFKARQERIAAFEDNRKNKIMTWFLIGAGVFVFGVLLGMSARKRRRSYLI